MREQTFISGTQHTPLVSSSFTQSNTIDEFRNNFQKNSWHMQLKLFQLRARYESVDIRMIFTLSTKNIHTHHTVDQSLQYKPCNNYKTRAKCFFNCNPMYAHQLFSKMGPQIFVKKGLIHIKLSFLLHQSSSVKANLNNMKQDYIQSCNEVRPFGYLNCCIFKSTRQS